MLFPLGVQSSWYYFQEVDRRDEKILSVNPASCKTADNKRLSNFVWWPWMHWFGFYENQTLYIKLSLRRTKIPETFTLYKNKIPEDWNLETWVLILGTNTRSLLLNSWSQPLNSWSYPLNVWSHPSNTWYFYWILISVWKE